MAFKVYTRCFLVLCVCAALFACSEDPEPTHADICADGPSVQCLLGSWSLRAIDNKTNNGFVTVDPDVGGILKFEEKDMWYTFTSAQISHEGTWRINEDKTIALECLVEGPPEYSCPANHLVPYQAELETGGDILRIHGSPFFDHRSSKPVEKFQFLP